MRVLIVGGGIGGLTTALALHARGIEAVVCEQASGIKQLGVGPDLQDGSRTEHPQPTARP